MLKFILAATCCAAIAASEGDVRSPEFAQQQDVIARNYQQVVVQIQKNQRDPDKAAAEIAKAKLDYDAKMAALELEYEKFAADEARKQKSEAADKVKELLETARKYRDAKNWIAALEVYKLVHDTDEGTLLAATANVEALEMMKNPEAKKTLLQYVDTKRAVEQKAEYARRQAECKRCLSQAKMLLDNGSKNGAVRLLGEYIDTKPGEEFEAPAKKLRDEIMAKENAPVKARVSTDSK